MSRLAWLVAVAACGGAARPPVAIPTRTALATTAKVTATSVVNAIAGRWSAQDATVEGIALGSQSSYGLFPVAWSDGRVHTHYLFTANDGPYGIVMPDGKPVQLDGARIVRVEQAGESTPNSVLTAAGVTVVDDVDPTIALADAVARWQRYLADSELATSAAFETAARDSDGRPFGAESTQTTDVFAPAWDARTRRLVVSYARTTTRASQLIETPLAPAGCSKYRVGPGTDAGFPGEPVLIACPQPPPPPPPRIHTRSYHVDRALVLVYRADGSLVDERRLAPEPHPAKGPF